MSAEFSDLSALYSAKCQENTRLEEQIQKLTDQGRANDHLRRDNDRLSQELSKKQEEVHHLKQRLEGLELSLRSESTSSQHYPPPPPDPAEPQLPVPKRTASLAPPFYEQQSEPRPQSEFFPKTTDDVVFRQATGRKINPNRRNGRFSEEANSFRRQIFQ